MSLETLRKKVREKNFSPFYVLYGTESFFIDRALHLLVHALVENEAADLDLCTLDMEEQPVELAIEEANTLPFLGERRVVVLKNCAFLTSQPLQSDVSHDLKKLQKYVENPAPTAVVLLLSPYGKLDGRKKIVKALKKAGEFYEFSSVKEKNISRELNTYCRKAGVTLTENGLKRLYMLVGTDMTRLVAELQKLILYVGKGGTIGADDVDQLASRSLETNVFALVDDVVKHNLDRAYRVLFDLLKQNEEPIKLLALIARQFRNMYYVRLLSEQGYSEKQMADQLHLHPYAVKVALGLAKPFSQERLMRILDLLAEADYEMKTGKKDRALILQLLFARIASA